jgi:membrane-associated phospholipid phosphatase
VAWRAGEIARRYMAGRGPTGFGLAELRRAEWLIAAYFCYVAALAPFFPAARGRTGMAWALAALIAAAMLWLARTDSRWRDWTPLLYTLIAYRQMDWFTTAVPDHRFDLRWIGWDRWLLDQRGLRSIVEGAGSLPPTILESCYFLVYGVAPVALWALLAHGRRGHIQRWWLAYLAGTLGAYALLPFFPSQPPRTAFAGQDLPHVLTWMRRINLGIVGTYGIHSSVFPSAHVSSAFSAAWGLLATLPRRGVFARHWAGWGMAAYGCAVAVAAVYGRYHYAIDIVGGFVVSFAALAALRLTRTSEQKRPAEAPAATI